MFKYVCVCESGGVFASGTIRVNLYLTEVGVYFKVALAMSAEPPWHLYPFIAERPVLNPFTLGYIPFFFYLNTSRG